MFILKKIISAWLIPPASLLLLGLFGLYFFHRKKTLSRLLLGLSLFSLLALSFYPVTDLLMWKLESAHVLTQAKLNQAQAIVVLGGGTYSEAPEYGGATVNRFTLERVRYAVALQRLSHLPILVTGGAVYDEVSDAQTMQRAIQNDFLGQVKWVENQSRDTAENAKYSAVLLHQAGIQRILLVSQAWHLKRAEPLFVREGLTVYVAPTGFTTHSHHILYLLMPHLEALTMSCIAIHEWIGIAVDKIFKGV